MQKLTYGIGILLAILIIVGLALPRTSRIEVTTEIDAPQATVFALVNDFRRFSLWAPWAKADPNAQFTYAGEMRGRGAAVSWEGLVSGSGSQLITESRPFEYIEIAINPGEDGEAKSWFNLSPGVGNTIVRWGFEADYGLNLVGRYFAPMLGGVVARDYQAGLTALKDLAESMPSADFGDVEIEHLEVAAQRIAYLSTTSRADSDALAMALRKAYLEILRFMNEQGLSYAGAPMKINQSYNGPVLGFDAAIPVRGTTSEAIPAGKGVSLGLSYEGPTIRAQHTGSYDRLAVTHRKMSAYLAATGIERNGSAWEVYVSDPGQVPEEDLLTYVYYPVRAD